MEDRLYVGLANTTVSEDDALQSLVDPAHKMTIHDKEQLFRMANAAVKEGANFITFPEFFIPIVWLKDLTRFSQKNNVSIIAGLRYIRNANRAFNCTTIIQPCNNNGFVNTIALFRESNIFNHNLISFPLLNYLPFDQIATRSFLEIQREPLSRFLDNDGIGATTFAFGLERLVMHQFETSDIWSCPAFRIAADGEKNGIVLDELRRNIFIKANSMQYRMDKSKLCSTLLPLIHH